MGPFCRGWRSEQRECGTKNTTAHLLPPASLLNPCDCRRALVSTVDKVPALKGKVSSGGRLNVARALAALLGRPVPNVPGLQCEPAMHMLAVA